MPKGHVDAAGRQKKERPLSRGPSNSFSLRPAHPLWPPAFIASHIRRRGRENSGMKLALDRREAALRLGNKEGVPSQGGRGAEGED